MANISYPRCQELLQAEKRLHELQEKESIAWFCSELSHALGTLMAHTPRLQWPREFRAAFNHMRRKAPTAAQIYLSRLPKD